MPGLPVAKLGILAIKQIAKPIAKGLKRGAISSKIVKNYVILPVAQVNNQSELVI